MSHLSRISPWIPRVLALLSVFITSLVRADYRPWELLSMRGPSPRAYSASAFDEARKKMVLFGGHEGGKDYLADTWEREGNVWTLVATNGPSRRAFTSLVYDSSRSVMVLFGGYDDPNLLGDTWEWDGASWAQKATTGPTPRMGHYMVYDSLRAVTVLHGGVDTSNTYAGDTWEWDGTVWTQVSSSGPARRGGAATFDESAGVTLIFGGDGSKSSAYDELWRWDGVSWTLAASGPATRRTWGAMDYDSARGIVSLYGGQSAGGVFLGDLWEWNGSVWEWEVGSAGNHPGTRAGSVFVYDSTAKEFVMFGGLGPQDDSKPPNEDGVVFGDTWAYRPLGGGGVQVECGSTLLCSARTFAYSVSANNPEGLEQRLRLYVEAETPGLPTTSLVLSDSFTSSSYELTRSLTLPNVPWDCPRVMHLEAQLTSPAGSAFDRCAITFLNETH